MKLNTIHYDSVVVGASLEAVLYCYFNKLKLIYTRNLQPDYTEKIKDFGLGIVKKDIWDKYFFLLSLSGFNPFENKIKHIRYEIDNKISIVSKEDNLYKVSYNNLYIFDDYNFFDLPLSKFSTSSKYRIVDTFRYKIKQLDIENLEREEDVLKQIFFEEKKKIIVVSYIEKNNIENIPEHLIKIKTQSHIGIKNLELDHLERKIIDLGQNVYEDFEKIKFLYLDAELIYSFFKKKSKIDYLKYLNIKLDLK